MICNRVSCVVFIVALSVLASSGPGAAEEQKFEGQVTYKTRNGGLLQYFVGKNALRVEKGPAMTWIFNFEKQTMILIMPTAKHYSEMPMPDLSKDVAGSSTRKIKKTGRTEAIAGFRCDVWNIEGEAGSVDACFASGMGTFGAFMGSNLPAAYRQAFGQAGRGLLLKLSDKEGVLWEATKVERKSIDPSLFVPPPGFEKSGSAVPRHG